MHHKDALCSVLLFVCLSVRIHRHALWILGEYANSKQDILDVTEEIKKGLGEVRSPFHLGPVVQSEDNFIQWINCIYLDDTASTGYSYPLFELTGSDWRNAT